MNNFEELNYQQQRFCDEYLVNFNAFRAALSAGYSENTARKCELLHNAKIQAYLKTGMEKARQRLEVTHDMILREFAKVAFSNMGNYYDERGAIKPMCCLTSEEKAAVSYYQIMDSIDEHGNRVGELGKIKLHNKMSALDKIARHIGFYSEKSQESRAKNQDEGKETQESRAKNQDEEETQESRDKNQDEGKETQESRGKNQDEGKETQELRGKNQDEGKESQESRGKNQDERKVAVVVEDEVCLVVNNEGNLAGETVLEKATSATVSGDDSVLEQVPAEVTKILTLSPQGRQLYSPLEHCAEGYDSHLVSAR
ncbi:MAG: terminase small subunit [Mucilaginibacter sp.]|uniref:terminase small subunit n=1 Tax=Mucilaginibacter sp. TaxID=1882438 RepID=UPI0032636B3E